MQQKRLESQCWQQQRSQCQIRLPSIQLADYETWISSSLLWCSHQICRLSALCNGVEPVP